MNKGMLQGEATIVVIPAGIVVIPAGIVWEYLGATPPPGWLLADGSAVSRAQYPDLFRAIGTQHGAGNGNTTFNLPNRKGQLGVGVDSSQTEFVALGTTGGSKFSTAPHTHDMGNHQHARTAGGASSDTDVANGWTGAQWPGNVGAGNGQTNGHAHSIETTTLGGGSGDGLQGWAQGDVHHGVQTTDRSGEMLFGGVIGGCCQTGNNSVYQGHDHQLENHRHQLETHTHAIGGHTHADTFGGANTNTTSDASVVQAPSGNLMPYIVVNFIIKV